MTDTAARQRSPKLLELAAVVPPHGSLRRNLAALLLLLLFAFAQALELHFIDVGQGDAVLIRSEGGQAVLYDGGRSSDPLLAYLESVRLEGLDLVVASHPDADHIGGLDRVIARYRPRFYMDNGLTHTTQTYRRLLESVREAGSQYLEPSARRITLGAVVLQVLPPPGNDSWGQNDNSVGLLVEYGEFTAALTGDAEDREFDWWAGNYPDLLRSVDVYKASHHGSRNGDSRLSMRAFSPGTVVISVGAGNGYGHPAEEATLLYASAASQVYRTDLNGNVVVRVGPDGSYTVEADVPAPDPVLRFAAQAGSEAPADAPSQGAADLLVECVFFDPAGPEDGREVVTLLATESVELSGWRLVDEADHEFRLPPVSLAGGERLDVRNPGRPVWNNAGDTAFLYDETGALVDSFSYSGSGTRSCR